MPSNRMSGYPRPALPLGVTVLNSFSWHSIDVGGAGVDVRVDAGAPCAAYRLWPSVGEYPVYDEFLYYVMLQDEARNAPFARAVAEQAAGRDVIEIGPGPDLLWSSLAARSGAASVLAVEVVEGSARAARDKAAAIGSHVQVVHGDAMNVAPRVKADMWIAEIVGAIGGAEGIGAVVDDAWRRYLRPSAVVVPHRVRTPIAALSVSELVAGEAAVAAEAASYVGEILRVAGSGFDLRMCITGLTERDLVTTSDLLEDLQLGVNVQNHPQRVRLEVNRAGAIDSCVLWLQLQCAAEFSFLDSLRTVTSWLPVLVPFDVDDPIRVQPGDSLVLDITRRLHDKVHPEWSFTGEVHHVDGSTTLLRAESAYAGGPFRASWLHRALFREQPTASTAVS
jgi:protein arginine N-methyltransferase 1